MSSPFRPADIPDLTGKIALVTGPKSGIGFETACLLASKGCTIYLAGRGIKQLEETAAKIRARPGLEAANLIPMELDLSTTPSATAAALSFPGDRIDILIANAGISLHTVKGGLSSEGWDVAFQINHLGHFAFIVPLLPKLEKSAEARIVVVGSDAHKFVDGLDYEALRAPQPERWGPADFMFKMKQYGASKLASGLFVVELARRLEERGVKNVWVNVIHPGTSLGTGLGGSFIVPVVDRALKLLSNFVGFSTQDAAMTQVYVATAKRIVEEDIRGKYWAPVLGWLGGYYCSKVEEVKDYAKDPEAAKKLWEVSEKAVEEACRKAAQTSG